MSQSATATREITLKVSESTGKDVGHGLARIDPADMQATGRRRRRPGRGGGPEDHRLQAAAGLQGAARQGPHPDRRHHPRERRGRHRRIGGRPPHRRPSRPRKSCSIPWATRPRAAIWSTSAACWTACRWSAGDRVRATLFGNRYADFLVKSVSAQGPRGDRFRHAAEDRRRPQGRGGRPRPPRRPSPTKTSAACGGNSTASARSSNCRCDTRNCSSGWASRRPRACCCSGRRAAARR